MGGWMGGWVGEWVSGWVGGWVDGWMDGWVGGWVGECEIYRDIVCTCVYLCVRLCDLTRLLSKKAPDYKWTSSEMSDNLPLMYSHSNSQLGPPPDLPFLGYPGNNVFLKPTQDLFLEYIPLDE